MKAIVFGVMIAGLTACATSDPNDDFALRRHEKYEADLQAQAPDEARQAAEQRIQEVADQKAAQKAAGH